MSKKILVATEKPFAKVAVEGIKGIFSKAGYETVLLESYKDKNDLLSAVAGVEALIIRSDKVDAVVLDAAKNLKIVVRAGAGYDNIDLNVAKARDVVAMNTPGQNSNAVAELVFGLMLNLARRNYTGKDGTELRGKTIGIHAYGNIGRLVAGIAKGFGMQVMAYDPFVKTETMKAEGVIPVSSAEEIYRQSDYISLHLPKTKETVNSINFSLLSWMKKGASLINTARAEVIDEPSLLKMLEERKDFYYASDIAPTCAAEINSKHPCRCFFTTKKMGAQTAEANINAGLAAARQIVDFFEKGDRKFQVNK